MPPACRFVGVDVEVGLQVPYDNRNWRVKKEKKKKAKATEEAEYTSAGTVMRFYSTALALEI